MERLRKLAIIEFMSKKDNSIFKWGYNDCCMWTGKILKAMHNVDFHSKYEGRYTTKRELKELIVEKKMSSEIDLIIEALGTPTSSGKPELGDAVLIKEKSQYILGVCCEKYNLFITPIGTTSRPNQGVELFWRM